MFKMEIKTEKHIKHISFSIFIPFLISSTVYIAVICPAVAAESAQVSTNSAKCSPPPAVATESSAEHIAKSISDTITREANWLDLFLAGKKYTTDRNQSSAELRQHLSWRDLSGYSNSTDVNLDIRLPNLEKRWALRFSSYDEGEEERDLLNAGVRLRPREKRPGAALVFAQELGNIKMNFQPRLLLKDPLVLNYILRIYSQAEKGPLKFNPQLQLFADAEKGTGELGSVDFGFQITRFTGVSFRSDEEYSDFENKFATNQSLSIGHALREDIGISLAGSAYSNNEPVFVLQSLNAAISFSHVLKAKRLSYAVSPYLDFPRGNAFHGIFGVSLEITVSF
jgi:hypothetical protein